MKRRASKSLVSAVTLILSLLLGNEKIASSSSPFPAGASAFVTPPASRRGASFASTFVSATLRKKRGRLPSRLHQSTVPLVDPKARNSTHNDASASPMSSEMPAAGAIGSVSEELDLICTSDEMNIDQEYAVGSASDGEEAGGSSSPPETDAFSGFDERDDRHEEGADAISSHFIDGKSGRSGADGGGRGNEKGKSKQHGKNYYRRAHAIAPPGYGKTQLALQTLTELRARNESINTALYIAPTLKLVDQALESCDEYGTFEGIPHKRMIVASKTSRDEARSTKPEVLADFLLSSLRNGEQDQELSFIVSTYKSLHRVGEALRIVQQRLGLASPPSIDFATFDEAHRTEGCSNMTGYGLYDDNISIERRFFMTATPKNYTDNPRKRRVWASKQNAKDGSRTLITEWSSAEEEESSRVQARTFRNAEMYGPCLFRRTSQWCVDNNITVPIKLFCMSKKEMMSELGQELNITAYTRDEILPFATLAAYTKLNVSRGVSYHNSIIRSIEFIERSEPILGPSGFFLSYVYGDMRRKEEERRLAEARTAEKSLVANCRLWREGVDVPEWDIVVVADSVNSPVDAKQIIGRVSRRYPGKECGYVFIPDIFDEDKNGFEADSNGYNAFVSIFQSMVEDDPLLMRDVLFVSGDNPEGRPLNVTEYPTRLFETFQLPAEIPLKIQQDFMRKVVMEASGGSNFSWRDWYALLESYKYREGDCLVPSKHIEKDRKLGNWVSTQRQALKKGEMTSRQKELLDKIGFCWDVKEGAWMDWYALLKRYKDREGNCLVPQGYVEGGKKLGIWVNRQRQALKKGDLTSHLKKLLDEIGFCWDPHESAWQEKYKELKAYREQNGHCLVSKGELDDDKLFRWVTKQRDDLKKGKLASDKKRLLDEFDFCWDAFEYEWEQSMKLLEQFAKREGHCDVPYKHIENGELLGRWLNYQRIAYGKGEMDETRQKRLEKLGINWNPKDALIRKWMGKFKLLVKFMEREGHCRVPRKHKEDGDNIGMWFYNQKQAHRKGTLAPERYQKLKELGVEW